MAKIYKPEKARLVIGMFASDESLFEEVTRQLERKYGKTDFQSKIVPFNCTSYYEKELGKNLRKKFISFKGKMNPENLADVKVYTNKIEDKYSKNRKRRINIDPGYVTLAKLVLATSKNYAHRIYLGKKVYAEVTLKYKNEGLGKGGFKPTPWTYPDYRTKRYRDIFNQIRAKIK